MEYTKLMSVLDDCCDQKYAILIYWEGGLVIKSTGNTGVFESDNGLDLDDENYLEYYACAVGVSDIIQNSEQETIKPELVQLK